MLEIFKYIHGSKTFARNSLLSLFMNMQITYAAGITRNVEDKEPWCEESEHTDPTVYILTLWQWASC